MADKVQIWNLALANILSTARVLSVTEKSTEANFCRIYYDDTLKELLSLYEWNFATKRLALSLTGTAPVDWGFQYSYPSDCVNIINVVQSLRVDHDPVPYEVAVSDAGVHVLLTDIENATLRYVFFNEDTTFFSQPFVMALSWALAAKIAMPVARKISIKKDAELQTRIMIMNAKTQDHNNFRRDPERESVFTRERF